MSGPKAGAGASKVSETQFLPLRDSQPMEGLDEGTNLS